MYPKHHSLLNSGIRAIVALAAVLISAVARGEPPTIDQIDGLIWQKQLEEAEKLITVLKEATPDAPEVLYVEGRLAAAKGDTAVAVEKLEAATQAAPDVAQFFAGYGTALVGHAQTLPFAQQPRFFMKSLDFYKKAVQLDPDNFEAHFGLAQYYLNAPEFAGGSLVLAEKHAKEAARLIPSMGEPLLAQIEERKKGNDE